MSVNILESMSSLLGGSVMRQAGALLGESEDSTRAGLRAGTPALLAGLMRSSADPGGASDLFRIVTSSAVDADIGSKLGSTMSNRDNLHSTLSTGESLLSAVLGNRAGGVTHAVSQVAGIKPSLATSLLAMVAPLLLGFLKKQVLGGGLDAGGLSSLLLGQRAELQRVGLDNRITNALGFGNLQEMLGSLPHPPREGIRERVTEAAAAYTTPSRGTEQPYAAYTAPPQRRSWLPWAIGAAIAVLAIASLLNRFTHNRDVRAPATATTEAPGTMPERTAAPTTEAPRRVASLPAEVYFEPGQANIDATDRQTLAEVASSAKASGTPVAVTGYTDQSGNQQQNLELAKNRADAVRQALIAEGLPESSVEMKAPAEVTGTGSATDARRVEIAPAQ